MGDCVPSVSCSRAALPRPGSGIPARFGLRLSLRRVPGCPRKPSVVSLLGERSLAGGRTVPVPSLGGLQVGVMKFGGCPANGAVGLGAGLQGKTRVGET